MEFWFWALAVKLGLPLLERLIRYDRMAADSKLWPPGTSYSDSSWRCLSEEAYERRTRSLGRFLRRWGCRSELDVAAIAGGVDEVGGFES